jgi:Membrane domain of glycerophosphoryl diester phosphodiesterase
MEGSIQAGGAPEGAGGGRGMRIGEILDAALKLYRGRARDLWLVALVISVPTAIIVELLAKASLPSVVLAHHGTIYEFQGESVSPVGTIATIVLNVVADLVTTGALVKCLLDEHMGRATNWRASISYAAPRAASLLWLSILTGVGVLLASILIVIPGIYVYVCWCVAVPVLMFEGKKGTQAMSRSNQLVKGRWWATFGVLLASFVIIVIIYLILTIALLPAVIGSFNSVDAILLLRGVFSVLNAVIVYPITAAVASMIYIDLRTRKEAFDLEVFADSLNTTSPAAVASSTFGTPPSPEPSTSVPPPSEG